MIVSIDHSPSEQINLTNNIKHTSVIIASLPDNGKLPHGELARTISHELSNLSPNKVKLRKWSGSSKSYKNSFKNLFFNKFNKFSNIYLFINICNSKTIYELKEYYIKELGLNNYYKESLSSSKNSKQYECQIIDRTNNHELSIIIPEGRFLYLIHLVHFIIKSYSIYISNELDPIEWCIYADRFPGNREMETLLLATFNKLNFSPLMWANFKESDTVEEDLLADNLAGMFNGFNESEITDISNTLTKENKIYISNH